MKAIKGGAVVLAVVSVILGLVIGYAIGSGRNNQAEDMVNTTSTSETTTTKTEQTIEYRNRLGHHLQRHVTLLAEALTISNDESTAQNQTQAALNTLDANSQQLAIIFNDVVAGQEEDFLSLWREHISHFAEYATAVKDSDEEAKTAAINNLNGLRNQITDRLLLIEGTDTASLNESFDQYQQQIYDVVDTHESGDYPAYYVSLTAAQEHMQGVADVLYEAAVSQVQPATE